MELNYFKDKVFEMLNDMDEMEIANIETNDSTNIFTIVAANGNVFELECRQVTC